MKLPTPSIANSQELLTPTYCSAATPRLEPTMKTADITLLTAMTRALLSAAAQLCTAANEGTTKKPPPIAMPTNSRRTTRPLAEVAKASHSTSTPLTIPARLQARARQQTPMMTPPSGTKARLGRTWLSRAASSEPMATPIAKTSIKSVLTFSIPPMTWVTTGASSDSVTAPASQNQQTINVPSQMRLSVLVSRI